MRGDVRVIHEWPEGEDRLRVIQWADGRYEQQRIFMEDGKIRWSSYPLAAEDVYRYFPAEVPKWLREQQFLEHQRLRRERVWWRRILREAGL